MGNFRVSGLQTSALHVSASASRLCSGNTEGLCFADIDAHSEANP